MKLLNTEVVCRLIILQQIPRFGSQRILTLLSHHPLEELFSYSVSTLIDIGLSVEQANMIVSPDHKRLESVLEWERGAQNYIVTYFDDEYPSQLKEISSPPLLLFVYGQLSSISTPQIAIVGARNATPLGLECAYNFGRDLVQAGVTVTSGLALGIDGKSHMGALAGNGVTLAVLGTGVNNIYPKRHRKLADEIVEHGAIVSEFWPNTPARAENFPKRNRLISGLSLGTLVIEAAIKSGSLITAKFALEQNREVFAIPGSINNPMAQGCHHLIKQGAILVDCVDDILSTLELSLPRPMMNSQKELPISNSSKQHPLLMHIDFDITPIDTLVERSGLAVDSLLATLLELEMAGDVISVSGGYIRNN